jgi:hypothetical protein
MLMTARAARSAMERVINLTAEEVDGASFIFCVYVCVSVGCFVLEYLCSSVLLGCCL